MTLPPIDIPIRSIGPGSQDKPEDEMNILNLPTGSMSTFSTPPLPEPEDVEGLNAGKAFMAAMLHALQNYKVGDQAVSLNLVNQALGEGEVSLVFEGAGPIIAQEAVLAGVWRVQHLDEHEQVIRDTVEIAAIPHLVSESTFANARPSIDLTLPTKAADLMNAPSLLVEINDQINLRQPDSLPHVINLTLLPMSDDELLFIGGKLGTGPVTILSRGYGNCRIGRTAVQDVWWIKYYNSEDKLILNTIEINGIPEVAIAAQEDIDDSAHRLDEILDIYR